MVVCSTGEGLAMHTSFNQAIFAKVVQAIEQIVDIEGSRLTPGSRLADDLRLGLFGRIRLALCLEEMFETELPDEALKRFDTVGDIVRYISRWLP
jgi:acyl carrier protein